MSKYVIDLELLQYDPSGNPTLWKAKEFSTLVFDKYGKQKLTPLSSEVCIEQLQETGWMAEHDKIIFEQGKECGVNDIASNIAYARQAGYEDGYNDGLKALQFTDGTELYTNGMNDAWAAALKVVLPEKAGGKYTSDEMRKIFGVEFDYQCLQKYTPQEVVRKFSDYDEQKKKSDQEIRVGDEIESCNRKREKYIVLRTYLNVAAEIMLTVLHRGDGDIDTYRLYDDGVARFRKTGNHFPQVADLMGGIGGTDG